MSDKHTHRFPIEAERGVIASAFFDADWLATARHELEPRHFCEPAHRALWQAILATHQEGLPADELSLLTFLQANGGADTVGGIAGINAVSGSLHGPTPNVARWQAQVLDGHRLRLIRESLERMASKADSDVATPEEIGREAAALADLATPRKKGDTGPQRFDFRDLAAFDRKADPDCLFGMRYLGRGQSCMFIAGTGVGKSSFINGAVSHWAIGRDYFGFKPKTGPLRSLVVQSENCLGDTAEAFQDALSGMGVALSSQLASDIGDRVAFYRESVRTGEAFGRVLRQLILDHKADIAVIDPMLGFSGCDVSKNDELSHWLRGILQPIMLETGVCLFTIHHTNKPRPASESALVNFDNLAYLGSGGAELANWHRSTIALLKDPTPEGEDEKPHYTLVAAKRGGRAGLKNDLGEFTRTVKLRHAREPGVVRWEKRPDAPDGWTADQTSRQNTPAIERKGTAKPLRGAGGYPTLPQ